MALSMRENREQHGLHNIYDETKGFIDEWWQSELWTEAWEQSKFLSFFNENNEEVVRAWVHYDFLEGEYCNINLQGDILLKIERFNVRSDQQRKGYGQEAISLILEKYKDEKTIAVFSLNDETDKFWSKMPFKRIYRQDQNNSDYEHLFVHKNCLS